MENLNNDAKVEKAKEEASTSGDKPEGKSTTAEITNEDVEVVAENNNEKNVKEPVNPSKDSELNIKDAKITELQNKLLRLQADFENFRRRTSVEREQLSAFVTAGVVSKFLKVLDNFERAEASAEKAGNVEAVLEGLKKIRRQFESTFKELDVVEINAMHAKFDPELHDAIMKVQNPELEDETIDMVLEKGYKIGNKVIRHSKVRVVSNE